MGRTVKRIVGGLWVVALVVVAGSAGTAAGPYTTGVAAQAGAPGQAGAAPKPARPRQAPRPTTKLPSTQGWPMIKFIIHDGYRSQGETNRDMYRTSWKIVSSGASTSGASAGPTHVVFAVDPNKQLPMIAVALWTSGHATLVSTRA